MRRTTCGALVLLLSLLAGAGAATAQRNDGDTPEPGSAEAIAAATTDPRYLSSWVASVPDSASVPSPSDFLGHIAGAANELPDSGTIYAYMRRLADASDRVRVETIGETEEGREILLVAIADEAGIRDLPRLEAATAALADPRVTSPEEADRIVSEARPFYYFNGAIHADESVAPDMLMELAYRLAVSENPMIQGIRRELVVLLNPVANPDGRDKMSDWFYRYQRGRSDYDKLPRQSPPYWGKYVFVDANRDAHQLDLATTQAVARMFFEYHPTVIHDLHEAIPLLMTWNGTGPYNPNLDPIVWSEFLEMSFHEMSTLSELGMPGVWTWNFGEGFGHHYTDSVAMNHNAVGRGYETFGNAVPLTVTRKLSPRQLSTEWYRPIPPPEAELRWSHRDGLNYSETAALSILDYSARQADQLLRSFYQKGYNSWQAGVAGDPYAFVVPAEQPDRLRVAHMIQRLRDQHIEVQRADADFTVDEGGFAAGDYVVRLDQPYRNYAVDLLLPQEFPADAEHEPYDDTSWSLPVHFGVRTVRIDDGAIRDVALTPVDAPPAPAGSVTGSGAAAFLLADHGQESLLAARYRLADRSLTIAERAFTAGGHEYPAGSWILEGEDGLADELAGIAEELALDFVAVATAPDVPGHAAPAPRIGVWVPWADTDMDGWIRLILDREEVPYTYLRDEDVRAGDLRRRVDVIVYGTVLLDLQGQIHGIDPADVPLAFAPTAEYPSLGTPAASDDISGGIGWEGLARLDEFVRDGGMLITLGNGSTLALDGGLIRHVRRSSVAATTPGAHLRARFLQPLHPIAYGYPERTVAFRSPYAFYDPPRTWTTMSYCTSCLDGPFDTSHMVLQWGTRPFRAAGDGEQPPILVSGGGTNVEALQGRPAILDVPLGDGRVIAYNFNPMHRDMNRADHRYLWNAILNWSYLVGRR